MSKGLTIGRRSSNRSPPCTVHAITTISVEPVKRLAVAHAERGTGYVAAPMFGRPDVAGDMLSSRSDAQLP
jgi:3-hydroxyisobutyrate dehydrogenase-like beta-hydroxyacid dehydrogenase